MEFLYVKEQRDIRDILNEETKIYVDWSKKPEIDYKILADGYMRAGYLTLKEITESTHSNLKNDMWFLPGVYMMRQAIELLMKAGVAFKSSNKRELQDIFSKEKHNVKSLYEFYKKEYGNDYLNTIEEEWLYKYIISIEEIDSKSDLFRYPFKDEFMKSYKDEALNIVQMSNSLMICYSTLNKMLYGKWFEELELDFNIKPIFLQLASTAIGNCYLWESPWSDGFYKQVTGYSEVGAFLLSKFKETKDNMLFYPIVFSMRNAIEIGLKRILQMNMDNSIDEHLIRSKRNSHLLYKDLWKTIKPMLIHYNIEDYQDMSILELGEDYIKSLNSLDKNGDMFRYPCTFSNEYKFNNEEVDVENFFQYLMELFNFIEACSSWLSQIKEYEDEFRREYEYESYLEWQNEIY